MDRKQSPWVLLGFMLGLGLGCVTTAAVAQQEPTPPPPSQAPAPPEQPKAQVVSAGEADARQVPSGKATAMRYVAGENAYVGRLQMDAGGAVPEHQDPTEEYIFILAGSGEMTIDGVVTEVGPNTAIYMPAGATVSYKNGDAPLDAIQVFAGPGPEAKYDKWEPVKAE